MRFHRLSKSKVTTGLQCHKLLWWRVHEPDAPELVPDDALQSIFDRGTRVGELARAYIPGGTLIEFDYSDLGKMVRETHEAIANGATVIYEASFLQDNVFVSVDILEKLEEGWALVEVKSTASVKAAHYPDVAVQTHVLRKAGLNIVRAELMHLNRGCRYPDLSNLFTRADITDDIEDALSIMDTTIHQQLAMLAKPIPDVAIGDHCKSPHDCPFKNRCWPILPPHHISTLYRGGKRAAALQAEGYNCIDEIPDAEKLSKIAARQREAVKADAMVVETKALTRELEKNLAWPMAFLDFETIQPGIPCWNGCRPFGKIAVQFSCHVMTEDGSLEHQEFLAQGADDPRRELAQALINTCGSAKVIWTYNMSFEKGCIVEIAKAFPDLADDLHDLVKRLRDLLPIIQNQVYHPNFFGSFSIKKVLPALVPTLSYEDLDIADGRAACMALEDLLLRSSGSDEDAESTRKHLLEYCKLDTLAMVRLWELLRGLVKL